MRAWLNRRPWAVLGMLLALTLSVPVVWSWLHLEQTTGWPAQRAGFYAMGALGGLLMGVGAQGMLTASGLLKHDGVRALTVNLIGFHLMVVAILWYGLSGA